MDDERLQVRMYGLPGLINLLYLPGIHGDWTLIPSFRAALPPNVCFVEVTYPRTLTWSLDDYAREITNNLANQGITHAWILGESFGSQVAWAMHRLTTILRNSSPETKGNSHNFSIDGIVLAGGFVRHPMIPAVRMIQWIWNQIPEFFLRAFLKFLVLYAPIRHREAPETLASIPEFVARRNDLDRKALGHRFGLIINHDPRSIASNCSFPVYYLTGFLDPIVPWPWVRSWLYKNCPSFKKDKIIATADHNVLASAAKDSAKIIMYWIQKELSSTST